MKAVIDLRTVADRFPGLGRYAFNLACELARKKDRPELVVIYHRGTSDTRYDTPSLALEKGVTLVRSGALPFTLQEQVLLPILLRRLAPDLTHFPIWMLPWASPRPFIATIHDIIPLRLPRYFSRGQRLLYRLSLAFSMRRASRVICLSEATRSDVQETFPWMHNRICVIPAGVGPPFHPCPATELERVRIKYSLPEKYLLYVGSNKPHKNLPVLVEAYARLDGAPPLVLAGNEDPRYPQVRLRIETLGLKNRVLLTGAIPEQDLPAFYAGSHAFVFPSLYEGFGLPPLEAMACGTPTVCSDIPSLRETTAGAALLFDPRNVDAICSALKRITQDEELRVFLRARGLQRSAELTWDSCADRILDVYSRLGRR